MRDDAKLAEKVVLTGVGQSVELADLRVAHDFKKVGGSHLPNLPRILQPCDLAFLSERVVEATLLPPLGKNVLQPGPLLFRCHHAALNLSISDFFFAEAA